MSTPSHSTNFAAALRELELVKKMLRDNTADSDTISKKVADAESLLSRATPYSTFISPANKRKKQVLKQFASMIESESKNVKPKDFIDDIPTKENSKDLGDEIFKNDKFLVYVRRIENQTSDVFNVEDHQYNIKLLPVDKSDPPFLIDVLDELAATFTYIITELKKDHEKHNLSRLYVHFNDSRLEKNISLAGLDLQLPAMELAHEIISSLGNTLRSNDSIKVDEGFYARFKLFSVNHIQSLQQQHLADMRKQFPQYFTGTMVGHGKKLPNELAFQSSQNVFDPNTLSDAVQKQSCLLSSLVFGLFKVYSDIHKVNPLMHIEEHQTYLTLKKLCCTSSRWGDNKVKKASELVMIEKITWLSQQLGVSDIGPHDLMETLKAMHIHLKMQMSVYSQNGAKRIHRVPEEMNPALPHIYLYQTNVTQKKVSHVMCIIKPFPLFKRRGGFPCHFCHKMQTTKSLNHKCWAKDKQGNSLQCFACCRYILRHDDLYVHEAFLNPDKFCKRTFKAANIECPTCQINCVSEECAQRHKNTRSLCQNRGFVCQLCQKYLYFSQNMNAKEAVLQQHKCFWHICPLCHENYDPSPDMLTHQCKVNGAKFQRLKPPLGIFDLETVCNSHSSNCQECALLEMSFLDSGKTLAKSRTALQPLLKQLPDLKSNLRCPQHQCEEDMREFHHVNCVTCTFEDNRLGHFDRISFFDPDMNHPNDCVLEKNVYFFDSLPDEIDDKESACITRKKLSNFDNKIRGSDPLPPFRPDDAFRALPAIVKFVKYMFQRKMHNQVWLAHNAQGFDNLFVAKALYHEGYTPNMLCTGLKIMEIREPSTNIRFIDSLRYIPGALKSFPKTFGIQNLKKGDFPHSFNHRDNYNYVGPYPPLHHFINFNDSPSVIQEKTLWYQGCQELIFDFKTQLYEYCKQDVQILMESLVRHIKASYLHQITLQKQFGNPFQKEMRDRMGGAYVEGHIYYRSLFHVYGSPFLTMPGFVMGCWKAYCMPDNLYAIQDESGHTSINSSKKEMEYALFIAHQHPLKTVHSKYTSLKQKSFGRMSVDIYIEETNTVINFLGCHFHGCPCMLKRPGVTWESKNCFGESYGDLNKKQKDQDRQLVQKFGISRCHLQHIWECEYDLLKEGDTSHLTPEKKVISTQLRLFLQLQEGSRPLARLAPRDALRGGRTETYVMAADATPDHDLAYVDYSSLYPSVCTSRNPKYHFPTGKSITLIRSEELNGLFFKENQTFYRYKKDTAIPVKGLLQLAVLAPEDMLIPFLPTRVTCKGGQRSVATLCFTCAVQDRGQKCRHKLDQRQITDTYTCDEIAFAVCNYGYKVQKIHEALLYVEDAPIYRDYLNILAREKIKYSGLPSDLTQEEKEQAVQNINIEMEFQGSEKLTVDEFQSVPLLRLMAKLQSNALLGKFGQNSGAQTKCHIARSQQDLEAIFYNDTHDIVNFNLIAADVLQITTKPKPNRTPPNLNTQVVIAAHVTAFARIEMALHIDKLHAKGIDVLYSDTGNYIHTLHCDTYCIMPPSFIFQIALLCVFLSQKREKNKGHGLYHPYRSLFRIPTGVGSTKLTIKFYLFEVLDLKIILLLIKMKKRKKSNPL